MPRRVSITRQKKIERNLQTPISTEPITSFDACPHCGGSFGYYCKSIIEGVIHDITEWDHESKANSAMYDSLSEVWVSRFYYCYDCDKPICRRDEKVETQTFLDSLPSNSN
jgi:hypothetical protein